MNYKKIMLSLALLTIAGFSHGMQQQQPQQPQEVVTRQVITNEKGHTLWRYSGRLPNGELATVSVVKSGPRAGYISVESENFAADYTQAEKEHFLQYLNNKYFAERLERTRAKVQEPKVTVKKRQNI